MTEIFGPDFDLNLHLILFNDIDFKDLKGLQKSKDRKVQYFLQDFPQYIEHVDFIENFSRILMQTKNTGTTSEIFNGLNKQCKLSMENQMKLIICFIMSDTCCPLKGCNLNLTRTIFRKCITEKKYQMIYWL